MQDWEELQNGGYGEEGMWVSSGDSIMTKCS